MRLLARRLSREQDGLSLTEVLVSMFLTLMIITMVGAFFISVAKITTNSNQTRKSNDTASNTMNEISAVVGVSTDVTLSDGTTDFAVAEATQTKLTVYSLSNTSATSPAPSKITFELVAVTGATPAAYQVNETKCAGTVSGSGYAFASACTVRSLGIGVLQATGTAPQLFVYNDSLGNPIAVGTGLNAASRDSVTSITVNVRAQVVTTGTPPTLLTNTIVLRNLGLDTTS